MSLTVCAIFKNEAEYIREWILFHKLVGVDNFLLFNNESEDDWKSQINDLTNITVEDVEGKTQQLNVYNKTLKTYKESEWVAFIDVDEYLYGNQNIAIKEKLNNYNKFDCVTANWLVFGSSYHKTKPEGLTIENYTFRENCVNDHFKSIVRSGSGIKFLDPHRCEVRGDTVNSKELYINHYWTRSEEECRQKFERGRADINEKREWEEFIRYFYAYNAIKDVTLKKAWAKKLKEVY